MKKQNRSTLVIALACAIPVLAACSNSSGDPGGGTLTIMHVSPSGNDSNPGTRGEPKLTIQNAIDAAMPPCEVHVAEGTFEITSQITMRQGVSIMGGYSLDFNERDPVIHAAAITDIRTPSSGTIFAIYSSGISATTKIDGFTVNAGGGGGSSVSYGIYNVSSSPGITNNIINGGSGSISYGINNESSRPTIANNTVNGGSGDPSAGIRNYASAPVIINNAISGGGSGWLSHGIDNNNSSPEIINNAISGGTGSYSHGIFNDKSSGPTITNNTISGGGGGSYSIGIQMSENSRPAIMNNIIYTHGAGTRYCIREAHVSGMHSDPTSVRNNAFFDCPGAFYRDEDATNITVANFNSQVVSAGDGEQTLSNWGNINEGGTAMFADHANGDLHLLNTAPLNVRGGGLVVSGVAGDKDGIARTISAPTGMTNAGATGWSMGAYENDAK